MNRIASLLRRWTGPRGRGPGRHRERRAVAHRRAMEKDLRRRKLMTWLAWGLAGSTLAALGAVIWTAQPLEAIRAIRRSARPPKGHPNEPRAPDEHPLSPRPQ